MTPKTTIAVTGATGLLGRPLCEQLSGHSLFRLRAAGFSRAGNSVDRVDITSRSAVDAWLDDARPQVLVHLAAERHPDVFSEKPDDALALNIDATGYLAESCARRGTALLFLSTNYVFDGSSAPYSPEDTPNPINDYGKSKYRGEQLVLGASPLHRVIRIPILYGPSDRLDESPVTLIAQALLNARDPVLLDVRQPRFPAYTPDVAAAIIGVIEASLSEKLAARILHFCPEQMFTKKDMGDIMARMLGVDPVMVAADNRPPSGAPRPENVQMLCPHMKALGLLRTTPFREAVKQTLDSILDRGVG